MPLTGSSPPGHSAGPPIALRLKPTALRLDRRGAMVYIRCLRTVSMVYIQRRRTVSEPRSRPRGGVEAPTRSLDPAREAESYVVKTCYRRVANLAIDPSQ